MAFAVTHAARLANRLPDEKKNGEFKSPIEEFTKKAVRHHRRFLKFGSKVYMHTDNEAGEKFKPKARVVCYLGLPPNQPGILVYDTDKNITYARPTSSYSVPKTRWLVHPATRV